MFEREKNNLLFDQCLSGKHKATKEKKDKKRKHKVSTDYVTPKIK